ncbi:PKD domain-containing protein [bacterium]|nr:PKD domain-containing protein [bacterium]
MMIEIFFTRSNPWRGRCTGVTEGQRERKAKWDLRGITWLMASIVGLQASALLAAPQPTSVENSKLPIDAPGLVVLGEGLDTVTTATLRRGTIGVPLILEVVEAGRLQLTGQLIRCQPGSWDLELEAPSAETAILRRAVTLWRPNRLAIIRGDGSANLPFSFLTTLPSNQMGLDVVVDRAALPPTGELIRVELEYSALPAAIPTGGWIRWRATDQLILDDLSHASGWNGSVTLNTATLSGSVLTLVPSASMTIDPNQTLLLSMILTGSAAGTSPPAFGGESASFGASRIYSAPSLTPPGIEWNGAQPSFRQLVSARPTMTFRYLGPTALQPTFAQSETTVAVGQTIQLTNTTGQAVTAVRWDIDGDGVFDSSEPSPAVSWSTPGTYSIEMVVSIRDTIDSILCRDCVTVVPASAPIGSRFAIH